MSEMRGPTEAILNHFDQRCNLYRGFTENVAALLRRLLSEASLKVHSIESRVKDRSSLEKKISASAGKYGCLEDITDVSGVRIITYYPTEVDSVANIIEREFSIDRTNSLDKRAGLDPDRFGYLSVHYICSLSSSRAELTEYRTFANLKTEIQVRSIVQHAWAEIQHDLGYKTKVAIPREAQRRFFQLAAMLEMADQEFSNLKVQIEAYESHVEAQVRAKAVENISIDANSLAAYIATNKRVTRLDSDLALIGRTGLDSKIDLQVTANLAAQFGFLTLDSLSELDRQLETLESDILAFAKKWIPDGAKSNMTRGVSLFYLGYLLASKLNDVGFVKSYLDHQNIGSSEERSTLAQRIVSARIVDQAA